MQDEQKYYDLTIIGGGPVGLFAATYARMHMAKTQVIESLATVGGQVAALFPAKTLYDIPAYAKVTGQKLIENLTEQTQAFKPEIHTNETVNSFTKEEDGFRIETTKRTTFSKAIIIAAGIGSFTPRKLRVENASRFEDKQLHYFVSDPSVFKGHDVAIAGGGDSAIDWALELAPIAKSLTIVHRRDQFRALESSLAKLHNYENTTFKTPYTIKDLTETATRQLTIALQKARTSEQTQLTVDDLIVNYGFTSSNRLIESWGLEMQRHEIKVNDQQETSMPGVYAIGDVAYKAGRPALIAAGAGEAPIAVNNALLAIYPERRQPAHSTELMLKYKE
ncbi:thioredoxin reductase [Ligilactobacillus salitolerans]|uniref:Ferredoxin--NADP reductase n=1 Tax=Ligilactobacillus salitolerans TaxID=1808352 RepID=A0A401ISZ8_9LACO|nr:NAD(P)/FAD-dependent oxidoreductase [Ligilactobacillus salitolerans]GBG94673.1 thioredoxin reductase [Ligilactobacillus salitolerans]